MKAYKGFNKNLTCNGYQYEIGKTYECKDAKVCDHGFLTCLRPIDVFAYYPPSLSRYCEVDVDEDGLSKSEDDSKVAARRITIIREINLRELHEAQMEYARKHADELKAGGDDSSVAGGDDSSVSGGNRSSVSGGNWSAVAGGERSSVSGGKWSAAASRGVVSVGNNGVAVCRGNGCKIRGGIGSVLVIAEESKHSYSVAAWKSVIVDGETIKADTWYKLENGKLVEAE
nr:MAG TPA: hypothetical protein [Caudoviricetes sp.]